MGTMGSWESPLITEASGLAFSRKWSNIVYVNNDENGPVYIVNWSTGALVGSISIKGVSLHDPETLSIDINGMLTLGDTGNNEPSDPDIQPSIYQIREPGSGFHGAVPWIRYPLRFPSGLAHNCETYLDRANGNRYLISKVENGVVYKIPELRRGVTLQMTVFHGPDAELDHVSDAVGQWDDQWTFVIMQDQLDIVSVFDRKWNKEDEIPMTGMVKPEGIAITKDGKTLGVSDDFGDTGGEYQTVKVPKAFWPKAKPYTPPPVTTPPVNPCAA